MRFSTVARLVMALRTKDRRQRESRRNSIVESKNDSLASADLTRGLAEGLTHKGLNALVSDGGGEDAARIEMRGPQKEEESRHDGNLGDGGFEIAPPLRRGPAAAAAAAKDKKFASSAFKKGQESVTVAVRRPKDRGQTQLKGGASRRRPPRADGVGDQQLSAPTLKKDVREGATKTLQNGTAADGRRGHVAPARGRKKRLSNLDLSNEKTTSGTTTSRMEPGSSEWQRRQKTTKSKYGLGKQPLSGSILPDGSERGKSQKRPSKVEGGKGGGKGVLNHRQKDDRKGKVEAEEEFNGGGGGGGGGGRPQISARFDLSDGDSGCVGRKRETVIFKQTLASNEYCRSISRNIGRKLLVHPTA